MADIMDGMSMNLEQAMEEAVVKQLISSEQNGKTCVLTYTNDEALRIMGLLLKHGKRAKLIQSLDGFNLFNLLEIRAFLKTIDMSLHSPMISDEIWNNAKKEFFTRYGESSCIDNIRRLIIDFETTHSTKYRTDFEEFLNESKFEDFYDEKERDTIYVSTIHKSKGREFDNVYILLKNMNAVSNEEKRALYVGITRAKNKLSIHTNTTLFDKYNLDGIEHLYDGESYSEPTEIMLQTTHKDVVLDYFKNKKEIIFNLRSGKELKVDDIYLTAELNGRDVRVAKFSKSFVEKLQNLKQKGYSPIVGNVRFIVAWKGEEDEEETPVLLTDISFKKE